MTLPTTEMTTDSMPTNSPVALRTVPARRVRPLDFSHWFILCMVFFTFLAAAVISRNTFERLPHLEDEFAYLYQARIFAGGYAFVPREENVAVFWQPFVIQPNEAVNGTLTRFGKYTPGFPLMLAPGAAMGQTWVMNAFFAMLNVALTYRLGRQLFGRAVGTVAATLLACSPLALILNASLMSHPSAMLLALIFVWAFTRILRQMRLTGNARRIAAPSRGWWIWSVIGGLAVGMLVASRPLTAIAIGLIPALVALGATGIALFRNRQRFVLGVGAFALMGIAALPTAALWPLYNYLWTGSPTTNTYTLQWDYDKVGFGVGYGPNKEEGHTLDKGFRIAREDLKFHWRDLFGLTISQPVHDFLNKNLGYGWGIGLAWVLLLLGLSAGRSNPWTWLLAAMGLSIVILQMGYWIGSSVNGTAVYSTRYYYEVTFAFSIIAAIGLVSLWRNVFQNDALPGHAPTGRTPVKALQDRRFAVTVGMVVLIAIGANAAFNYTPARMAEPLGDFQQGIYRFNDIGQNQINRLNNYRRLIPDGDKPILLMQIEVPDKQKTDNWRNYGAMLAETSPFLNSDVVVARVFRPNMVDEFLARFPTRRVIYQVSDAYYDTLEKALQAPVPDAVAMLR